MEPDAFKVSTFDPKPLLWWRTQRAKIDMDPPYQRKGGIWSVADKAYLIDSILNDYDVPKFYLADFTFGKAKLNKRKLSYAIVDGKQRFEAIFEFFDGKLVLDDDFRLIESPALKLGGLSYPDLRKNYPEVADKFDSFALSVMRIVTDSEEAINDLFVRLNRSKPLTGAEVRNAASGQVSKAVREIVDHEFFRSYLAFTNKRLQQNNAAGKLLYFEYNGKPMQTKKKDLDAFVKAAKSMKREVATSCRAVLDVLDELVDVFLPRDKLLSSAGVLPDYYWFVRNSPTTHRQYVREFLVDFDRRRREYQLATSKGNVAPAADPSVASFIESNRDTNDKGAHERRIQVLTDEFEKFTRQLPSSKTGADAKAKPVSGGKKRHQ